jgi:inward rectifier potassium channel
MAENKSRKTTRDMTIRAGAFALTARGVSKYDWRDPYHIALTLSWPRFFILILGLDLLINLIFALLYVAEPGSIRNAAPGSLSDAFFFSIETLATVGYGEMAPGSLYGHVVAAIEIFSGMGFVAITAGLLFVRFSRPRARILYADHAIIGRFNGRRTLMIRIANGRPHALTDAHARLTALFNEWSKEGQFYRRIYDLPLLRAHVPIFGLTWTLMHEIDEKSPLYGYDQEAFHRHVARVFLAIDARDPMLEARVYDTKDYAPEEVLFDRRYSDAVAIDQEGRTIADLTRVGLTEPEIPDATALGKEEPPHEGERQ